MTRASHFEPSRAVALIVACARAHPDAAAQQRISECADRVDDWDKVIDLAVRHGLSALLYTNLQFACPQAVPERARGALRERSRALAAANVILSAKLLRLIAAFETAGIATIAFKGPALAEALYGNVGLREFHDLDLLVHERDLAAAWDLLLTHGYVPPIPWEGGHTQQLRRYDCECQFLSRDGNHGVDLHWHIAPRHFRFGVAAETLWLDTAPVRVAGGMVRTFGPESLLLVLAVTTAKHHWDRLNCICDIAELIRQHAALDWDSVWRNARACGIARILDVTLRLAHVLMDAPVPPRELARGVSSSATWLVQRALGTIEHDGTIGRFEQLLIVARGKQQWQDALVYAWGTVVYPTFAEWTRWRLPQRLGALYYPLRAWRLLSKIFLPRPDVPA